MTVESSRDVLLVLGSNIAPDRWIPHATALLRRRFDVRAVSRAYRSPAVGCDEGAPPFVNRAMRIRTPLSVRALHAVCRHIEEVCGRRRGPDPNAPRTMDIDIVLVEGLAGQEAGVVLPDPGLARRAYLLVPATEAWPEAVHPVLGERLDRLASRLSSEEVGALETVEDGPTEGRA